MTQLLTLQYYNIINKAKIAEFITTLLLFLSLNMNMFTFKSKRNQSETAPAQAVVSEYYIKTKLEFAAKINDRAERFAEEVEQNKLKPMSFVQYLRLDSSLFTGVAHEGKRVIEKELGKANQTFDVIVGIEPNGVALGQSLATLFSIPFIRLDLETKQIEDRFKQIQQSRVLLVDDIYSPSSNLKISSDIINQMPDKRVKGCFVIYDDPELQVRPSSKLVCMAELQKDSKSKEYIIKQSQKIKMDQNELPPFIQSFISTDSPSTGTSGWRPNSLNIEQ